MPCAKGIRDLIDRSKADGKRKKHEDLGPVSPDLYTLENLYIIYVAFLLVILVAVVICSIYLGIVSGMIVGIILLLGGWVIRGPLFDFSSDIAQQLGIWRYDRYFRKRR